jgi:dihydrodipicolinate reductase
MLRARYGNVNRVLTEKKRHSEKKGTRPKNSDVAIDFSAPNHVEKVENVDSVEKTGLNLTPLLSSD